MTNTYNVFRDFINELLVEDSYESNPEERKEKDASCGVEEKQRDVIQKEMKKKPKVHVKPAPPSIPIKEPMLQRMTLRQGMIMYEVLGPPRSRRLGR